MHRVLSTTENHEAQELLVGFQQQPGVFVLSYPAVAIPNVGTASEFLADGLSAESVCRVVRTATTKQENNVKERAEHALCTFMHDEMTTFDTCPANSRDGMGAQPKRHSNEVVDLHSVVAG